MQRRRKESGRRRGGKVRGGRRRDEGKRGERRILPLPLPLGSQQ